MLSHYWIVLTTKDLLSHSMIRYEDAYLSKGEFTLHITRILGGGIEESTFACQLLTG